MARIELSIPTPSHPQTFGSSRWERNGVIRFDLEGELDRASSPSFGEELAIAQGATWRAILLDASNLSFMDPSGLHVLMDAEARPMPVVRSWRSRAAPDRFAGSSRSRTSGVCSDLVVEHDRYSIVAKLPGIPAQIAYGSDPRRLLA